MNSIPWIDYELIACQVLSSHQNRTFFISIEINFRFETILISWKYINGNVLFHTWQKERMSFELLGRISTCMKERAFISRWSSANIPQIDRQVKIRTKSRWTRSTWTQNLMLINYFLDIDWYLPLKRWSLFLEIDNFNEFWLLFLYS